MRPPIPDHDDPSLERIVARARSVGGPALRALGLRERAFLVRQICETMRGSGDFERAAAALDAGIAAMSELASACSRDLPSGRVLPFGAQGHRASAGQEVMVPRAGVAFIAGDPDHWPLIAETLAAAMLSGLPCVLFGVPGTVAPAWTAWPRRGSAALPEGVLARAAASPGTIAPLLEPGDIARIIAPRAAPRTLRDHPLVISGQVMLDLDAGETDLVVIGPDRTPDAPGATAKAPGGPALRRGTSTATCQDVADIRALALRAPRLGRVRVLSGNAAFLRDCLSVLGPQASVIVLDGAEALRPDAARRATRYMARVDLAAAPGDLATLTGSWIPGAPTRAIPAPFSATLDELEVGDHHVTDEREVTEADVESFAELTGDRFYAHMDAEAARAHPFFEGRVAHGQLVIALAFGLMVDSAPGPLLANLGCDAMRFHAPVYFGARLRVALTCARITPKPGTYFGEVRWHCEVLDQRDACVAQFELLTLVSRHRPATAPGHAAAPRPIEERQLR